MQYIPAAGTARQFQERQDWFALRRDFFVRQLYVDFFDLLRSFQDLYQVYLSCRSPEADGCSDLLDRKNEPLRSRIWEKLTAMVGTELEKGPLWQLKDLCHRLWPEQEHGYNLDGSLIDWLVGSLFHEAMKLKENIYILNSYGPAAFRIGDPGAGGGSGEHGLEPAPPRLARIMDVKGLIRRIVVDVIRQMDQLAFLFGQAGYMLRTMIPALAQNMLVVRFLVEQEDLVFELWGEKAEDVFEEMFYGAPEQGFCSAGRSYLNGQWYDRALAMYTRAIQLEPGCDEAFARVHQLRAVLGSRDLLLETL
jgi:hypothetical protein